MHDDRTAPACGDGWIKLHRRYETDGHFDRMSDQALRLFVHFLLKARWRPEEGLLPGQHRTSYRKLRDKTGYSFGTIKKALDQLRAGGHIVTEQYGQSAPMVVTVVDLACLEVASPGEAPASPDVAPASPSEAPRFSQRSTPLPQEKRHASRSEAQGEGDFYSDNARSAAEEHKKNEEEEKKSETALVGSNHATTGKVARRKAKADYSEEFEGVWTEYPHPVGDEKDRAHRNYQKLRKTETAEILLQAVRNYAASRRGQDRKYHKKAANFFGEDATWKAWVTVEAGAGQSQRPGAQRRPSNAAWAARKEALEHDGAEDVPGAAKAG